MYTDDTTFLVKIKLKNDKMQVTKICEAAWRVRSGLKWGSHVKTSLDALFSIKRIKTPNTKTCQ